MIWSRKAPTKARPNPNNAAPHQGMPSRELRAERLCHGSAVVFPPGSAVSEPLRRSRMAVTRHHRIPCVWKTDDPPVSQLGHIVPKVRFEDDWDDLPPLSAVVVLRTARHPLSITVCWLLESGRGHFVGSAHLRDG